MSCVFCDVQQLLPALAQDMLADVPHVRIQPMGPQQALLGSMSSVSCQHGLFAYATVEKVQPSFQSFQTVVDASRYHAGKMRYSCFPVTPVGGPLDCMI